MKTFRPSLVVLALLLGCTRGDPIDRLVASCADSKFPNGFWKPIQLPSTATPGDLALMALRSEDATATNFAVISTRKVRIVGKGLEGLGDPNYTAIVGSTGSGEKIALLQFKNGTWYARIYNAK